jgi:RsiW-degrading membrane proteinase PrsW (M82 family)
MAAATGMPVLRIKALLLRIKAQVPRLKARVPRLKTLVLHPEILIHQAWLEINAQRHATFVSSLAWGIVGSTGRQIFPREAIVIVGRTVALPAKFTISENLSGLLIATAIGLSVLLVCVYLFLDKNAGPGPKADSPRETVHECIVDTQSLSKVQINNLNDYIGLYNLCNDQIFRNYEYNDFAVRREKFVRQELDERVNLWLVVIITLSGVILSGVQLLMSYKIALSGKEYWNSDATFAIKQGEISFKSSVTGLAILAMSLAFFVVYVGWIYPNKEVGAALGVPVPLLNGQQLPPGGLGPPPANDADKAETTPSAPPK